MLNKDPAAIQAEIVRIKSSLARETNQTLIAESQNLIASKQSTCKRPKRSRIK